MAAKTGIFIVDTIDLERLELQFFPEEINDSNTVNYDKVDVPGISHPTRYYINGDQSIKIPLKWAFEDEDRKSVIRDVTWLRQRALPDFDGTPRLKGGPHIIKLVWGSLFPKDLWVIREVNIRWSHFKRPSLNPNYAHVDLTLDRYIKESLDQTDLYSITR